MRSPNFVVLEVVNEFDRASRKFPPFHSAHEGYAVIQEELDELWDAIKKNDLAHAKKEAVQVAATAIRFLMDIEVPK